MNLKVWKKHNDTHKITLLKIDYYKREGVFFQFCFAIIQHIFIHNYKVNGSEKGGVKKCNIFLKQYKKKGFTCWVILIDKWGRAFKIFPQWINQYNSFISKLFVIFQAILTQHATRLSIFLERWLPQIVVVIYKPLFPVRS